MIARHPDTGELIGGSDIMLEMYQKGEIQKLLEEAQAA